MLSSIVALSNTQCCHAIITCCLDDCNSLYFGIEQSSFHHLKLLQNAVARPLTGVQMHEHITPVLSSLHLLPVRFSIDFKVLLPTFKAWHLGICLSCFTFTPL